MPSKPEKVKLIITFESFIAKSMILIVCYLVSCLELNVRIAFDGRREKKGSKESREVSKVSCMIALGRDRR